MALSGQCCQPPPQPGSPAALHTELQKQGGDMSGAQVPKEPDPALLPGCTVSLLALEELCCVRTCREWRVTPVTE